MGNTPTKFDVEDEKALIDYNIKGSSRENDNATLYTVQRKSTKEIFIAKIITCDDRSQFTSDRGEVLQAFLGIDSPFVVKCFQTLNISSKKIGLILENSEKLSKRIEEKKVSSHQFSEKEIYKVISECGQGMKAIHDKKIIHRNINPDSIWIVGEVNKIGDFGVSIQLKDPSQGATTMVGIRVYSAPEICRGEEYTNKVDVFSFGVVLSEMIMLKNPFSRVPEMKYVLGSYNSAEVLESQSAYSAALLQLVRSMINADASKRPTIDDVLKAVPS